MVGIRQPSNYTDSIGLINESFLVSTDAFTEHIVRPALIGEDDGDEDQRDDGHYRQCVLR